MFSGIKSLKIQLLYVIGYKFTMTSGFIPFRVQKYKKKYDAPITARVTVKSTPFEIHCKLQYISNEQFGLAP